MFVGYNFDDSETVEREVYEFDFTPDLVPGETIVSAVWVCLVATGTDPTPAARMVGPIANQGAVTQQWFAGFVPGVKYILEAQVTTTLGQILSYYSHVSCFSPT